MRGVHRPTSLRPLKTARYRYQSIIPTPSIFVSQLTKRLILIREVFFLKSVCHPCLQHQKIYLHDFGLFKWAQLLNSPQRCHILLLWTNLF